MYVVKGEKTRKGSNEENKERNSNEGRQKEE
jgi:hypothetical protein